MRRCLPRYPATPPCRLEPRTCLRGGEVHSFPSCPCPLPEARPARPLGAELGGVIDEFHPDLALRDPSSALAGRARLPPSGAGVPVVSTDDRHPPATPRPTVQRWLRAWSRSTPPCFNRRQPAGEHALEAPAKPARASASTDVEVRAGGVDTEPFHPGRRAEALRAALGMGIRVHFLYVGRLASEKRGRGPARRLPAGERDATDEA